MAAQTLGGNLRGPVDVREDHPEITASRNASVGGGAIDTHGHNTIYLDSSITFEAYNFWAERAREEEKHFEAEGVVTQFKSLFSRDKKKTQQTALTDGSEPTAIAEKDGSPPATDKDSESRFGITASEWEHANRAARTATWTTIFYLITTE
jgi:hypothetical protein